ncbi:hypothetical protein IJ098_01070 [Candidatus Saccharibacteria bacterium]|nr:hypothetical protein [Candidatus Saccharibacteria bacterium]
MKIAFPELNNPIIKEAVSEVSEADPDFEAIPANSIEEACTLCKNGSADALIAGIDYTTRDMVLACRDYLGVAENPIVGTSGKTFSSCFVLKRSQELLDILKNNTRSVSSLTEFTNLPYMLILADAGVTKNPTTEQLTDIVLQTHETALKVLDDEPRIAMLSFSTFGSARDESIDKIHEVISRVRTLRPEIKIDGEMQLDAAINPRIAEKKAPSSPVAGHANVLIVPDLNSGNILYKSLEQFGGYTAAGPILQGFIKPCSDLSRGSTKEDVLLVIDTVKKLCQ